MSSLMAGLSGGPLDGKLVKMKLVAGWKPSIGDSIEFAEGMVYEVVNSNGNRVIVDALANDKPFPEVMALGLVHVPGGEASVSVEESCGR